MLKLKSILVLIAAAGFLSSCNPSSGSGSSSGEDLHAVALAMAPSVSLALTAVAGQSCTFNQTTIASGGSVTAYQNSTVAAGQVCVSEQRTCQDGVLSGSYNYASCQVNASASCLFDGQTLASGETVIAYYSNSIELGGECISENRTCTDGVLSGSYQYSSCNLSLPASCLFNGQTVANGSYVNAYQTSTVDYGSSCALEQRVCNNGQLSGSYQYSSCQVATAASCLFNGQTVASGESVKAFQNSSVASGQSCVVEDRTCTNGVLSGSYNYASCQVDAPASCLFDGKTVASGDSITAYQNSAVDYGQMCIAESRTCDDGHLSGSYQYSSCDVGQAASCLFAGSTVPDGGTVTAFATSSVAFGSNCQAEQRSCNNGQLSGSYQYISCSVSAPKSCLFNGQNIASGESVIAFQAKNPNSNSGLCESEMRTCNNGVLSGSYAAASCSFKNCDPNEKAKEKENRMHSVGYYHDDSEDYDDNFHDDDRLIKVCKNVEQIKRSEHTCEKFNESLRADWYKYKEKYDCGLHLGWYKHKHNDNSCGKKKSWYHCRNKH